jgi:hypothetical protein
LGEGRNGALAGKTILYQKTSNAGFVHSIAAYSPATCFVCSGFELSAQGYGLFARLASLAAQG